MSNASSRPQAHASVAVLALGLASYVAVYLGLVVEGPVASPLLSYLPLLPIERLLSGALWLFVVVELGAGRLGEGLDRVHAWARPLVTSLVAGVMFYVLRDTAAALGDGPSLTRDPVGSVIEGGYYTFIEELIGMWLPLRLGRVFFNHGVQPVAAIVLGYRVVSIGFGMLYTGAVAHYARRSATPRLTALLFLSHAAVLLFMGYVENYVGAFALLAVALLLVAPQLEQGSVRARHTLVATGLCALAAMFHGVAVWSAFALVLLAFCTVAPGFGGRARVIATNVALGLGIVLGVYVLFHYYVTPGVGPVHLEPLVGQSRRPPPFATSWQDMKAVRPLHEHALALLRVGAPALLVLIASLVAAPRQVGALCRQRDVQFALLFLLGFLVHQALWRSGLGIFRDWDLFGFTAIPLVYLAARAAAFLPRTPLVYALVFGCSVLGGLSWGLAQGGAPLPECEKAARPWGGS